MDETSEKRVVGFLGFLSSNRKLFKCEIKKKKKIRLDPIRDYLYTKRPNLIQR